MLTVKPISIIQEILPLDTSDIENMEYNNKPIKSTPKLKVVAKPTTIPMPINVSTISHNSSTTISPVKYTDFIKNYNEGAYFETVSVIISEWANRGDLSMFLKKHYKKLELIHLILLL